MKPESYLIYNFFFLRRRFRRVFFPTSFYHPLKYQVFLYEGVYEKGRISLFFTGLASGRSVDYSKK